MYGLAPEEEEKKDDEPGSEAEPDKKEEKELRPLRLGCCSVFKMKFLELLPSMCRCKCLLRKREEKAYVKANEMLDKETNLITLIRDNRL